MIFDYYALPGVTWDLALEAATEFCSAKKVSLDIPGPPLIDSTDWTRREILSEPLEVSGVYLLRMDAHVTTDEMKKIWASMGLSIPEQKDYSTAFLFETPGGKCAWMLAVDRSKTNADELIYKLADKLGLPDAGAYSDIEPEYNLAWHYETSDFEGTFAEYRQMALESGLYDDTDDALNDMQLPDNYGPDQDDLHADFDDDEDDQIDESNKRNKSTLSEDIKRIAKIAESLDEDI